MTPLRNADVRIAAPEGEVIGIGSVNSIWWLQI